MSVLSGYSVRRFSDVVLIRFHPPTLHESNATELANQLMQLAEIRPTVKLYLDFSALRNVSRWVWLELIGLNEHLRDNGCRLCALNLSPSLAEKLHSVQAEGMLATVAEEAIY